MSDLAVCVESLSKKYSIGNSRSRDLRESIYSVLSRIKRRTAVSQAPDIFWALRDVSFEIKKGEAVAIIGRNGAGKSTLLKILSRITKPTYGRAVLDGRVSALLEVGTGFHPELTGRENIFLNGTILGMRKAEIKSKFDEIVDFSGVEKFIDTPVKHYSSGMYVRLAFSVAVHLEPEILIIDEVLAVGDAEFQRKSVEKMDRSIKQGKTVLFVSHNMTVVENLCSNVIVLQQGKTAFQGDAASGIDFYLRQGEALLKTSLEKRTDRTGNGKARFIAVEMLDARNNPLITVASGQLVRFRIKFKNFTGQSLAHYKIDVSLSSINKSGLAWFSNSLFKKSVIIEPGQEFVTLIIDRFPLVPDRYFLTLFFLLDGEIADWITDAFSFDVSGGDFFGSGTLPFKGHGTFLIDHSFEIN
jgi:lipopolysaccharide transport system ATP-binding protein